MDTRSIIAELEAERDRLDKAISALQGSRAGRRSGTARRGRRFLTAADRKKISDAMKARWAKRKKAS